MKAWKPTPAPFRRYKKELLAKQALVANFIYQIGEFPSLRQVSKPVIIENITSPEYKAKIRYMKNCLLKYRKLTGKGRALAGVQLGIPENMIAVWMPEIKPKILILINPKIIRKSKEKLIYPEMCMSAMPAIAPVVRRAWVEVEYYDEKGSKHKWTTKADDKLGIMYNRVFQHEIDHLHGIINIDLVQSKDIIYESDPTFYKTATFTQVAE